MVHYIVYLYMGESKELNDGNANLELLELSIFGKTSMSRKSGKE